MAASCGETYKFISAPEARRSPAPPQIRTSHAVLHVSGCLGDWKSHRASGSTLDRRNPRNNTKARCVRDLEMKLGLVLPWHRATESSALFFRRICLQTSVHRREWPLSFIWMINLRIFVFLRTLPSRHSRRAYIPAGLAVRSSAGTRLGEPWLRRTVATTLLHRSDDAEAPPQLRLVLRKVHRRKLQHIAHPLARRALPRTQHLLSIKLIDQRLKLVHRITLASARMRCTRKRCRAGFASLAGSAAPL